MSIEHLFDSYAEIYDVKFNQNPLAKYQRERVHQEISPYLKSVEKILDVGCGPGSDFEFYKSLNLKVEAIDISQKMVELAREESCRVGLNSNIQVLSLEQFQSNQKYSVIILNFGVINSIVNLDLAFNRLSSLLEKEGILVIVSMPPFHLFFVLEMLLRFRISTIIQRVVKRNVVFEKGATVFFYGNGDLIDSVERQFFSLIRKINLGWLLPAPDQYQRWVWARLVAKLLIPADKSIGRVTPDFMGGDHICYIFQKN